MVRAVSATPAKKAKKDADPTFNVVSVEKTDPPSGCDGDDWYQYVIERGRSTIVGARRGTLRAVKAHAVAYANDLNARAANGGVSLWSPRRKAQKAS